MPKADDRSAPQSRLLAALPSAVLKDLEPALERVFLEQKRVLYEANQPIEHVYFPQEGMVSILAIMHDGTAVEVATVGNEGVVGLPIFLGSNRATGRAISQIPGFALRMR